MSELSSARAMRPLILGTLLVPIAAFTAYFFFSRFYDPNEYPAGVATQESHFEVRASDGTTLYGTVRQLTSGASPRGPVIFVADRGLDRDWNSSSLRIQSGARLARFLGGYGITTVRYDQRGTGQSLASRVNSGDPDLQAEDLATVVRFARSLGPAAGDPILLAHGDGCGIALYALDRRMLRAEGVVMLACDLSGSLLENWGHRLLDRLRRAQVRPATLATATADWNVYLRDGTLPPALDEKAERELSRTDPDLAAFRAALRHLNGAEMNRFAAVARGFYPARVLATARVPVLHLVGEFDEEVVIVGGEPRPRSVAGMDHFLRFSDEKKEGLRLVWARINPFGSMHAPALRSIAEFLLANAPPADPGLPVPASN